MTEVPVIQLGHLTEAQRRALVIADNQFAISGAGWDEETLRLELATLEEESFDLNLIGFDDEELARLLAAADAVEGLMDEDDAPDVSEAPLTMPGDLWLCKDHKLLVGDATVRADVDRLMSGDVADLIFIDTPYNCDYSGYTEEHLTIQNDRMSDTEFKQFLEAILRSCHTAIKPCASLYACHSFHTITHADPMARELESMPIILILIFARPQRRPRRIETPGRRRDTKDR